MTSPSIALIGLGPRGISTLERLIAQARSREEHPAKLVLHLIDEAQHGGGNIWDINQPRNLCMNTFAHGMTLFAEPGASVSAPVVQGPTIYEWIQLLLGRRDTVPPAHAAYVDSHPLDFEVLEKFPRAELEEVQPNSYLPRVLYGHYLLWFFRSILTDAPSWIDIHQHHARATGISQAANTDQDIITLNNGASFSADATLVVTGWSPQGLTRQEEWIATELAATPALKWIRAGNPIDQGIEKIKDNENVLARGLGMGFFDVAILSTQGRGGRFIPDDSVAWGLRYEPTGKEPTFFVSSRRGYPYLPQPDDRGIPAPSPIPRLRQVLPQLASRTGRACIDYDAEVWPAVAKDAYQAYVDTLARVEPEALLTPLPEIIAEIDGAEVNAHAGSDGLSELDEVIERHTTTRFSLRKWIQLLPPSGDNPAELTAFMVRRLTEDLADSIAGPHSPARAALGCIRTARKPTQVLGAEGRYTFESKHNMFETAVSLSQITCAGPPIFRIQQLLALVDAGVVHFVGANPSLGTDRATGEWTMSSQSSGGKIFRGTTLLDAWVHKPDVRRPSPDPFFQSLQDRLQPFTDLAQDAAEIPTASPAQDPQTRQVINPDGNTDQRLHIVGVPAHDEYPDTTLSPPLPGTDSWFIQETDKAATSALRVALS